MTPSSEPVHLSNHHRTTLAKIFQHPVSHNLEWKDVLSLVGALGTVEEKHAIRTSTRKRSSIYAECSRTLATDQRRRDRRRQRSSTVSHFEECPKNRFFDVS